MSQSKQRKLLALDGGGLMGIISLGILMEVEDQLRSLHGNDPKFRLRDFFDFIGGTSTGAIIAAGLMMGRSVAEIRDFYLNDGAVMFTRVPRWKVIASGGAFRFDKEQLTAKLKQEFTEKTLAQLQDAQQLPSDKHLLMVMRNATTDSCWPLSTNPASKYNDRTRDNSGLNAPLWQLIRASTAAPSFFQPEFVTFGDKEFAFVDGGLTPHNNPALKMYQMTKAPEYNMNWRADLHEDTRPLAETMMIMSIGTGLAYAPEPNIGTWGSWLGKIAATTPAVLMRAASVENDVACRSIGMCTYGHPIDRELGAMISSDTARAFTYARYDADLSIEGLSKMGLPNDGTKLKMENVKQIPDFVRIGERAAADVDVAAHFAAFVPGRAG